MISLKVYNYVCRQDAASEQDATVCKRKVTTLSPLRQIFNIRESGKQAEGREASEYYEISEDTEGSESLAGVAS